MDPFFQNKISKSGHKNTPNGFKIFEKAIKDEDIKTTAKMFIEDCSDDGAYYHLAIWKLHTMMYMVKGKFLEDIKNEDQPLWFNIGRDVIAHFMKMKQLREKAYERLFTTNSNESTTRVHNP